MTNKEFFTQEEVAQHLGVTIHAVRKWRANGKLEFVKIGSVVRINKKSLDAFLNAHTHNQLAV